ncbi:MAG TPA: DUF4383 domain-containing protein [Vicinamibacterales bacterium]|nr:DUF4383 domain-containing protein [Vicinamibacterales bacterium]
MSLRAYALLVAVVLGLIGLAALVPGAADGPPLDAPALLVSEAYAFVMGIFPVNVLDSVLYLAFAGYGFLAWHRLVSATTFARMVGVCFAVLTVMGLIEPANTAFGLLPVFGFDVALHAVLALSGLIYGFVRERAAA